jgi:acyl-CoA thioester hydrolase
MLPVVEAQVRYHMPARFDDRVIVRLWIEEITRVKVVFAADIVNADTGKTLVSARTTHVCTDLHDKPQRLPSALASAISAHVRTELA